eukprot:8774233-Pyramimonas_sp.AAC.1
MLEPAGAARKPPEGPETLQVGHKMASKTYLQHRFSSVGQATPRRVGLRKPGSAFALPLETSEWCSWNSARAGRAMG